MAIKLLNFNFSQAHQKQHVKKTSGAILKGAR